MTTGAGPLAAPGGAAEALRILVVDDDEVDRRIVRRGLARAGVQLAAFDEAATAIEAIEAVGRGTYDCVFLDYTIPGGDGLTLLRGIRQSGVTVPVVMLTGQGDEEVAVELMKAGAVDYIPKSAMTPQRLERSLRYAVELARAAASTRTMEQELRASAERLHFIADVSRAIAGTLDVATAIEAIAHLSVPRLGDFCIVYLLGDDGPPAVAAAHADPAKDGLIRRFLALYRPERYPHSILMRAIRTGESQRIETLPDAHLADAARDDGELEVMRALISGSVLALPLTARGHVIGAAVFARGVPFDADDVLVIEDVVQRAATALDNARLFRISADARRHAEESAARTERLQQLTAALAGAGSKEEVGELVMEHGVLPAGAHAGVVAAIVGGSQIQVRTSVGYPPEASMHAGRTWPIESDIPIAQAIRTAQPVFVEAPEARAAFPLAGDTGIRGAILWSYAGPRTFNEQERAYMAAVAQQCAQALERARLRAAERNARAEAEEANRTKSEFLARMSHDLRTPLNAIAGYSQLLELGVHGPVNDSQLEALARIRRAQEHLLTLINDILSFAKLEAGQVQVTIDAHPVAPIVDELAMMVRPEAARLGLTLAIDAGPEALLVRADRARLMQVLTNLTSNALKFTETGTVTIAADGTADGVEFRVTDTGAGIPRTLLERIFDPFVQARTAADEARGGVGLGLAISRELTRLMGGELAVESREGVGSTFVVRLPAGSVLTGTARPGEPDPARDAPLLAPGTT